MIIELNSGMLFAVGVATGCFLSIFIAMSIPFAYAVYKAIHDKSGGKQHFDSVKEKN